MQEIDTGWKKEDDEEWVVGIRRYYVGIITRLMETKEPSEGEWEKIAVEIQELFDICQFWSSVDTMLDEINKNIESEPEEWNIPDIVREIIDLPSKSNLELEVALQKVKACFDDLNDCKDVKNVLDIRELFEEIVKMKESDIGSEWFSGREMEIGKLMEEVNAKIHQLDWEKDEYVKNAVINIKICVLKFNQICAQEKKEAK